jgi:hypothetical protein
MKDHNMICNNTCTGKKDYGYLAAGIPLKILIIFFWIIQLWTSPYYDAEKFAQKNYNFLFGWFDSLLQADTLVGKRFAWLEVTLLLLGLILIKKYGIKKFNEKISKRIFFISLFIVLLCFLNPNNSFDELKYLFSYQPRILLLFIFLLFIFMSVNKQGLVSALYYFILYGFIVAITQAFISSLLFAGGNGVKFLGSDTTLPHSEILNVMVIFNALALSLYLKLHRKFYLLIVLLFHITIIFADRRTQTAILMIVDLMVFLYYRRTGSRLFLKSIAVVGAILTLFYFLNEKAAVDIEYFTLRIYAVFGGKIREYGQNFTDMGHWEQTALTFSTLFSNLNIFWGGGLRNDMFYVYGQSSYIHNSFAAVWAQYGIPMALYLLFVLQLFGRRSFVYLKETSRISDHPILAPIVFSYTMILVGDVFTGEYFSKHFVYTALFVFVISFLRLNKVDEDFIFRKLACNK